MKVFLSTSMIILVLSSYASVPTRKKHNHGLDKRKEQQLQRQSEHYGLSQKRRKSTKRRDNAQDILYLDRAGKHSFNARNALTRNKRTFSQRELIRSSKGHSSGGYRMLTFPQIPQKKRITLINNYVNHSAGSGTFHRNILPPWPSNTVHKLLSGPMEKKKLPYISKGRHANAGGLVSTTIRRYTLSYPINNRKSAGTGRRHKVDEALSEERQNIGQTFDNLGDIPDSLSRGLEEDGLDMKEVNMIDNSTLSDYFQALNGNGSDSIDSNKDNDISANTQTQQQPSWNNSTLPVEELSGNDEFYDAIDRGEKPPMATKSRNIHPTIHHPIKIKSKSDSRLRSSNDDFYDAIDRGEKPPMATKSRNIHPTIHHPIKIKSKSDSRLRSSSTSRPPKFRMPSRKDFENFFRGMLGKQNEEEYNDQRFSEGLEPQREQQSATKPEAEKEGNVTAFPDGGGRSHNNFAKVVSVGSPETAKEAKEPQTSEAYAEHSNPFRFTEAQVGRDGEGMASFNPSMSSTLKRPFHDLTKQPQFRYNSSSTPFRPAGNIRNSSIVFRNPQLNFPSLLQVPSLAFSKQYDQVAPSTSLEGTHIKGGKISGGQISGGIIEGGQIKAGLIEGGIIKGGQVLGGRIRNGTMDGGVIANGQMLGGHLVDGRIEGGLLVGGNVFGGKILGGRVEGGNIKGGVVAGGRFRGGNMQGGLLKAGEVQGGNMRGGKVEGGILHSGNIEGGEFKFGDITGGTLKSGSMLGGELKNGSIEGGTLAGGTIEGGVLKGGIMEGGKLKGGIVLAGKIKGGIIEGGVIEGGEIGDGVVIRNGTVNATIVTAGKYIDRNQNLGGIFRQHQNLQQLELHVNKNQYHKQGMQTTSLSSEVSKGRLLSIGQELANEHEVNAGLNKVKPDSQVKLLPRIETLKMISTGSDAENDDNTENKHEETENWRSTSQRLFEDDEPSRLIRKEGRTHHIVFDGISFDIPNREFRNLIDKMKEGPKELEDIVSYFQQLNKKTNTKERQVKSTDEEFHIEPKDIEAKSTPTKARSSVTRWKSGPAIAEEDFSSNHGNRSKDRVERAKDKSVRNSSNDNKTFFHGSEEIDLKVKDNEKLRPTYHWSLNKLIKPDRIAGSPGPAIRTHGGIKVIHGGLHFNGHDAWLGAGDFSGGCISDPDICDDGLSFEMTLRMDKEALKYNDMNYIVDSGASTFKSKGFTLYTLHGNLRADLAIANQEYCLQIPLIVDRWQDILVTWNKSEGMKMHINCELKAHTNGDEHCLGCHAPGCHVTDANTLLMIGRPNFSPHFHCTKFDSGDISFWERRLSDDDVKTLCGIPTGDPKKFRTSTVGMVPVNQQLKFRGIPLNQTPPQINSFQGYSVTQPNFDRFTGLISGVSPYAQRLFSPWSAWSVCSKTCGIGIRARRRICVNPSLFIGGGLCSGLSIQHKSCFDRVCSVLIQNMASPFFPTPLGRPLTFNPIQPYTGLPLPGLASMKFGDQAGLARALTVDGGYSEWSAWGTCDRSCDGGAQVRTRICNNPLPRSGGKSCRPHGPAIQVRRCNRHECPVDGGYSSWSGFTPCSKTCGSGGTQKRVRTCSNPAPRNGGKPCSGDPIQTRTCSTRRCPIDGGYSSWSQWSPCDADCGGGIMERNRFCNYPLPRFGGKDCSALGAERETRLCNLFACNE